MWVPLRLGLNGRFLKFVPEHSQVQLMSGFRPLCHPSHAQPAPFRQVLDLEMQLFPHAFPLRQVLQHAARKTLPFSCAIKLPKASIDNVWGCD